MAILSPETRKRIAILFPSSERRKVAKLLSEQCGNNLPLLENADEYDLERFRFAALKLSAGDWDALCRATDLAKADWRDLLVAAEFADDIYAHKKWCPTARQS